MGALMRVDKKKPLIKLSGRQDKNEYIPKKISKSLFNNVNDTLKNEDRNENIEDNIVKENDNDKEDFGEKMYVEGKKEDNEIFNVENIRNCSNKEDDYQLLLSKLTPRNKRSNSFSKRRPTDKKTSTRTFLFDDNVFDFYKINKSDNIFNTKSIDIDNINNSLVNNLPPPNKYSTLFNEISEICRTHYENLEFLKLYENFKPYLKFFQLCLKEAFNLKCSNIYGISNKNNNLKRILLVDDIKQILKALKNVTSSAIKDLKLTNKLEIIKAYDGVDALALFKIDHYTSQSISFIISDHNMSMMDGVDFIKLVSTYKLGRDIKLFISSTDNEIIKSNNIKNVEFINKPVRKTDIKDLLSKLMV